MPKLCLITDAASPHTCKWLTGCAGLDWEIVVVSHRPAEIPGVKVYHHPMTLVGFFRYAWGVRRLIRQINPDVIHVHQFGAHGLYALAADCAPVVITAWGSDIMVRPKKSFIIRFLTRLQIKQAALMTAVSQDITRTLIDLGAEPRKILTFPFGVPRKVYDQISAAQKNSCPFIICSPRLHEPIYNLKIILEAFAIIHEEFPDVHLWMLGDGSQTEDLKQWVEGRRLSERVRFWGRVSPEEFSERLAESHLMVSIPASDGTPISLLEAMAAGCLPIVSDLPVYREWICDNETGYIVKADAETLATRLRSGIEDAALRERAMAMNRQIIREKAITEELFVVMMKEYEALARTKKPSI